MTLTQLPETALLAVLLMAAWSDVRCRRIPNRLVVAAALLAALSRLPVLAAPDLWQPLAAAVLSFCLLLPLWQQRLLGGGDLKLFVATALWASVDRLIEFALAVALAGGVLALLLLAAPSVRSRLLPRLAITPYVCLLVPSSALTESSENRASVPYGVAIAAGAFWLWLDR
jgi:prepilin peptidase CpaA